MRIRRDVRYEDNIKMERGMEFLFILVIAR